MTPDGGDARRVHALSEIEAAIRASWALDTADETNDWSPGNPSCGQCDVTSLVVHDLLGGELLAAEVTRNGEPVEMHMWNRLPGGEEIDLTRDQFKQGEAIGEPIVVPRSGEIASPHHARYHRYAAYLVLARRVRERLSSSSS